MQEITVTKSKVNFAINNMKFNYAVFHESSVDIQDEVNKWLRTTDNHSVTSLIDHLRGAHEGRRFFGKTEFKKLKEHGLKAVKHKL
jgi:hypothetical protein